MPKPTSDFERGRQQAARDRAASGSKDGGKTEAAQRDRARATNERITGQDKDD